jgi:transposase-like protein
MMYQWALQGESAQQISTRLNHMELPTMFVAQDTGIVGNIHLHTSIDTLRRSLRFAEKRVCPFCGGTHVVKNGTRKDGTQKYICKECGRNPLATSNSILCGTHKDLAAWLTFIECELNDEPLNQIAEKCGIHVNTALNWRHKLHGAVSKRQKETRLSEVIELDETYPAVSYK